MMNNVVNHPEAKEIHIELLEKEASSNNAKFKKLFSILEKDLKKTTFKVFKHKWFIQILLMDGLW